VTFAFAASSIGRAADCTRGNGNAAATSGSLDRLAREVAVGTRSAQRLLQGVAAVARLDRRLQPSPEIGIQRIKMHHTTPRARCAAEQ
jgi:hypothetical protein